MTPSGGKPPTHRARSPRGARRCKYARPSCARRSRICWCGTGTGWTATTPPTTISRSCGMQRPSCWARPAMPRRSSSRRRSVRRIKRPRRCWPTSSTRWSLRSGPAWMMPPMNERAVAALIARDDPSASGTASAGARAQPRNRVHDARPLIAHVIFRLAVGGLENGLVNLINRTPQYRHAIICLTDYTDFHRRIRHDAVSLHALHKREGHDFGVLLRLRRLLRSLRPDLERSRTSHLWLRRAFRPLVRRYIPLSRDLERYLRDDIGVPEPKIAQIYNGVDAARFHPASERAAVLPAGFAPAGAVVIGTVGRLATVKDQITLVRAFITLLEREPQLRTRARLVIVGDGELRTQAQTLLEQAGVTALAWLSGAREDVPELMRAMDVFVLPSLAEGISNTILEAMASGLPVVATRVGGNGELVVEGTTGMLVPAAQPGILAEALAIYIDDEALRRRHGASGRARVEREFSMEAMVARYVEVYQRELER